MLQVSVEKEQYLSDFERFEKKGAEEPAWIQRVRQAAIARFAELNFPTIRDEEWRFTTVAPILQVPFRPVFEPSPGEVSARAIEPFTCGQAKWSRLVFVNGQYSAELSSPAQLPPGVKVINLAQALLTDADALEPHLARHAVYDGNAFTALNTAFMQDGAYVYVPSGKIIEQPIHLLFISTARKAEVVSYPRNLILLGRGSMATVIESYIGLANGRYFTNAVTEVVVGEGAVLEHYKIQLESEKAFHIASLQAHQDRNSLYSSFSFAMGSALARNDLNVLIDAEGGECMLNGLYYVTDRQHVDNYTFIDHAKPHGTSNELYKGILDGEARAVFNGRIRVRKDAQQTDAHQTNRNLFLSDTTQVNTNPQLEILADDVKCTHGATVGQLDEEAMFYLKSRGITQRTARSLLTHGFASDVINRIKIEPIRAELSALVLAKMQHRPKATEVA